MGWLQKHVPFQGLNEINLAEGIVCVVDVEGPSMWAGEEGGGVQMLNSSLFRAERGPLWLLWNCTMVELQQLTLSVSFVLGTRQLLHGGELSLTPAEAVCQTNHAGYGWHSWGQEPIRPHPFLAFFREKGDTIMSEKMYDHISRFLWGYNSCTYHGILYTVGLNCKWAQIRITFRAAESSCE